MVCGYGGLRVAVLFVRPEISWTGRRGHWCEFTKRLEPTNQQQEQQNQKKKKNVSKEKLEKEILWRVKSSSFVSCREVVCRSGLEALNGVG